MAFRPRLLACLIFAAAAGSLPAASTANPQEAARLDFFEKKVRPLLANNCYNCHSANTNSRGGLRVDDRNGMIVGGGRGPAVVPGHPEKSLLIQAVRRIHPKLKMPPQKPLTAVQIADLTQWIKDGAAWPQLRLPASITRVNPEYEKLRRTHWAWQPLQSPQVPQVKTAGWARTDLDRFVLARLEAKGLQPVGDADRLTLLRRVTFDLTGLPPTPAQIDAFANDPAADAFEKVVDRLLAAPAFGERWGRHWLDVARYGESTGSSRNVPFPHAWRYRDYVIDAFNHDKPYDQFIREQIAGDLLPAASPQERDEHVIATGFLALGVHDVNQRFKVRFIMDNIDEQIDTVSRSVLALTVSCARCHNHKFDPIPTTDYYALAGIFHSSDQCAGVRNKMGGSGMDYYDTTMLLPLTGAAHPDPQLALKIKQTQAALVRARAELGTLGGGANKNRPAAKDQKKLQAARKQVNKLQNDLNALTDPAVIGPVTLGVRDAKTVGDTEIRIRGQAEQLGPTVPRGFLSLLNVPGAPKVNPKHSGRLELSLWLTSARNPLTPRVMANRVWQHLFGQGLVSSVDNFGVTGDLPSHPDLLDHLARRFLADGWSVKKLVRHIVLSRAYQLSSEKSAAASAVDPANHLVWRHNPRRLDAEEIRDATLAAAGQLDLGRPRASPAKDLKVMEMTNNGPLAKRLADEAHKSKHRSVYLPLLRGLTPPALEVFDFAEQGMVTGSRAATTVATQALYLLNDPFVRQQALALAARLRGSSELDDVGRIHLAYRLTLARPATAREIARAQHYLTDYAAVARTAPPKAEPHTAAWASFCQALVASAEFRYLR
jgi:cytochrome c553